MGERESGGSRSYNLFVGFISSCILDLSGVLNRISLAASFGGVTVECFSCSVGTADCRGVPWVDGEFSESPLQNKRRRGNFENTHQLRGCML